MIPKPEHVWYLTGSWPFSVPGLKFAQVSRDYPGFAGPGWYPRYSVLCEETGAQRDGEPTFRVTRYAEDPRPAFARAANLPTRSGAVS